MVLLSPLGSLTVLVHKSLALSFNCYRIERPLSVLNSLQDRDMISKKRYVLAVCDLNYLHVCLNCVYSDLLRDEIMESKLEAVMALAALLQVFCFIDIVVNASILLCTSD